jgi:hypothetical protein
MLIWDLCENEEVHSNQFYDHFTSAEHFIRTGYTLYSFSPDDQENFASKWWFSEKSIISNTAQTFHSLPAR